MVPLQFNIYISDLPTTVNRKYAYADDLAIMHADGDWQAVERVLTKDMATVGEYVGFPVIGVFNVLNSPKIWTFFNEGCRLSTFSLPKRGSSQ